MKQFFDLLIVHYVEEAREVRQDRIVWRSDPSAYPAGDKALCVIHMYVQNVVQKCHFEQVCRLSKSTCLDNTKFTN